MAKTLFKGRLTMSNTEGRSDVTFSRWTEYGKDRVYVTYGSKGHSAGYIDAQIDGVVIKENTFYKLKNGEFKEA